MGVLLEVNDLLVRRGERAVLDVDHLEVLEGEVLAVIGPNGSGKSTLLLVLSKLLQPAQGRITLRGQPLEDESELKYRRRIGLVLQEPLLMDTSVFSNVAMGLRFRKLPRREVSRRVNDWLQRLGVDHLKDRPARTLSGGEAQRVSLARAFALQPEVLLLDEPFSALDAPTRARLLEDFQALLVETGITTLFVTHDLDEALFLGDRVAVLLDGRLRQSGPPQEVFSAPADRDVAAFVGVETVLTGQVVAARNGQVSVDASGALFEAVGDLDIGRAVMLCLRPEDITLWPDGITPRREGAPASSARNRIQGRITRIIPQGPLVRVQVDCGFPLVALITRASTEDLGLVEGKTVSATFKASAIHLIPR